MVTVAVAGGTGGVGRTIVDAILASGKHELKILSRKPNPEVEAQLKTPVIAVDYADVEAVTRVLEENNVHTVISAISMLHLGGPPPREIELIRAADASKTTRRMISSDWGPPHIKEHEPLLASVGPKFLAKEELKRVKDLETTCVQNGFFLDYYGHPNVKTHMAPAPMILDIPNDAAAIPGSGNTQAVFPHSTDVARFVTLMLDLEKWDPVSYVDGDRVTWNEFLQLAQEAKGTKFNVTYDSVEKLKKGETTELPSQVAAYPYYPKEALHAMAATFGLWYEEGVLGFRAEKTLNQQFPEVKTWTVKEFLQEAWGRRSAGRR